MHWLNWYCAMCFNRMLNRKGHFWEQRYHSSGFHIDDKQRALNTLRYIHANPKACGMRKGFFYTSSNYGTYERLTDDGLTQWHPAFSFLDDGLTQWHPAFLEMGNTLDECAARYRNFCIKYSPKKKKRREYHWGSQLLAGMEKPRRGVEYHSTGQMNFVSVKRCQVSRDPRVVSGDFADHSTIHHSPTIIGFLEFANKVFPPVTPYWRWNAGRIFTECRL